MKLKQMLPLALAALLSAAALFGCASGSTGTGTDAGASKPITVITRESGSGTRGAFIELFGIEEKAADGTKVDRTVTSADVNDSTGVVLTSVAANENAIGYISLGSLNSTVKALSIDGAEATVANIQNGTYKISRPFNVATKENLSAAAKEFLNFILSAQGQKVVQDNDYIPLANAPEYTLTQVSGKVTVAGSSSVTPLMEKLKEAYLAVNPNASIEIQQSDSSSGMTSTIEGVCDIGMASRELKDSELSQGLQATVIATDGIAVIVNQKNAVSALTSAEVCSIYLGELTDWSGVAK